LFLRSLTVLTLLLTAADHWTTYICLRSPIPGWDVVEANPLADWLFELTGLLPGLLFDAVLTLLAVLFLVATTRFTQRAKAGLLAFICLTTGYAVINNLGAISALGVPLLG
jgi:hypothetical protein